MSYVFAILQLLLGAAGALQVPEPRMYQVDYGTSNVYVVVHRAGLLSFLGHEHAVVPMEWSAEICAASPVGEGAHGSLVVRTASLVIDSDSARSLAGMGGGPGEEDRRDIQSRMLGPDYLDVTAFPDVRLELFAAGPVRDGRVPVVGEITLHGVTRDVRFEADMPAVEEDRLLLAGTLRIHQRDFGIEPESRAGLVKVSNDVDLRFSLEAARGTDTCVARPAS
jgi:hypothetical protein